MSFGGKTDLALDLTNPEQDRNSTYQEATPLPDVRGNGNLGLIWICKNTEPKLTKVGSTHFHYHGSIAGLLNHGIVKWIGTISINGKVVDNLDYTWNGSETYHDFTIDTDGGHTTVQTSVRIYFGTETQTADSILNAFHAQTHPAYRGQAYIVFQNLYGGDGTFRVPNVTVQFRSTCEFDYDASTYGDTAFGTGINPVTHLHHMVTHPRAGLGIDEDTAFDMADMAAKYLRYDSEANTIYGAATTGYINPQLTKNRKAKDWIKENLSYFDGFITLRNGKLNLDWFPHEAISPASPSEYTTIYQADLVDKPDIEFPVWEDTISSVAIDFINIEKSSRKSSLVVSSTHNSTVLGENRTEQITRDWFWWEYQVQSYGERYLAAKESPLFSGKLNIKRDRAVNPDNGNVEADRRGVSFLPGHVFLWNYAPYSIAVYCRITSINPRGHTYEVSFVQERGTYPVEYIPTPDPVPDLTLPTPDPLDNWALYNLPPALTGHYKNYLGVLAERFTKKTVSWDITFNDSDTWGTEVAYLLEQVSFAARFEIQESVADEAGPTTFEILGSTSNVDMTDIMQSLDAKQAEDNTLLLFVGTEVMSLEANSLLGAANYDVTAYRGRYSTPTAAYSTSQVCWVIPRANLIQWYHEKFDLVYTAGAYDSGLATKWFKTNTYNFYQEGTWSSSQSFQIADQIPAVPTGFAVTAGVGKVYVEWTNPSVQDFRGVLVQWSTDPTFAAYPYNKFIAANPGEEGTYTIEKYTDGSVVPKLIPPGVTIYVRLRSSDRSYNESAWSSSLSALTVDKINDVPDFSAHGKVGGAGDITYKLSGSSVYIYGSRYIDTDDVVYPIPDASYVTTPLTNGTIYPVQTWGDGGGENGLEGAMYIAHIDTTADTVWPLAGMGGPGGEQFFVCVSQYSNGTWYVTDAEGEHWSNANLSSIAAHIIAKIEREPGYAGGITRIVPYTTGLKKPLENELEFDTLTAAKAYSSAEVASIPNNTKIRWKGRAAVDDGLKGEGIWDNASTDTADDFSVVKFTAVTTGRIKRALPKKLVYVKDFGATGDGSTDDSTAIDAFCDWLNANGGTGIITAGTYRYATDLSAATIGAINITASDVEIIFMGGATLYMDNIVSNVGKSDGISIQEGIENIRLVNPRVVWSSKPTTRNERAGIAGYGYPSETDVGGYKCITNIQIENPYIENSAGPGLIFYGCQDVHLIGVTTLVNTNADGVHFNYTRRFTVDKIIGLETYDDTFACVNYYHATEVWDNNTPGDYPLQGNGFTGWNGNDSFVGDIYTIDGTSNATRLAGAQNVAIRNIYGNGKGTCFKSDSAIENGTTVGWTYYASRNCTIDNIFADTCDTGLLLDSLNCDESDGDNYYKFDIRVGRLYSKACTNDGLFMRDCSGLSIDEAIFEDCDFRLEHEVKDFHCRRMESNQRVAMYGFETGELDPATYDTDHRISIDSLLIKDGTNGSVSPQYFLIEDYQGITIGTLEINNVDAGGVQLKNCRNVEVDNLIIKDCNTVDSADANKERACFLDRCHNVTFNNYALYIENLTNIISLEVGGGDATAVSRNVLFKQINYVSEKASGGSDVVVQAGTYAPVNLSYHIRYKHGSSDSANETFGENFPHIGLLGNDTMASGGSDTLYIDDIVIGKMGGCLVSAQMFGPNHVLSYLFAAVTTNTTGITVATLASDIHSANGSIAVSGGTTNNSQYLKITYTRNASASTAAMECKYRITPLHNLLDIT
jgi:hypothetical protein